MNRYYVWIMVLALVFMITSFSRQPSHEQDLTPYINKYPQIINLVQDLPPIQFHYNHRLIDSHKDTVSFVQFGVRKVIHFILYGLLGIVTILAFKEMGFYKWNKYLLSAILVIMVAFADEYMQTRTLGRTGCWEDVVLDFTGFTFFALMYAVFCNRKN